MVNSDLLEAGTVRLVCSNCCWPVTSTCHGTSTVVGVAAWLVVSLPNEIAKGEAHKSKENKSWSHGCW